MSLNTRIRSELTLPSTQCKMLDSSPMPSATTGQCSTARAFMEPARQPHVGSAQAHHEYPPGTQIGGAHNSHIGDDLCDQDVATWASCVSPSWVRPASWWVLAPTMARSRQLRLGRADADYGCGTFTSPKLREALQLVASVPFILGVSERASVDDKATAPRAGQAAPGTSDRCRLPAGRGTSQPLLRSGTTAAIRRLRLVQSN
jgi:hypothetical protein